RHLWQLGVAAVIILIWQFGPESSFLSQHFKVMDRFFVSSPTAVWNTLVDLSLGHHTNGITMWPYLRKTIESAVIGTSIGIAVGCLLGLLCSNSQKLSDVVRPFIVMANTVPRVALIPIFIVLMGPSAGASIVSVVTVVFFLAFFNAFEGGRS